MSKTIFDLIRVSNGIIIACRSCKVIVACVTGNEDNAEIVYEFDLKPIPLDIGISIHKDDTTMHDIAPESKPEDVVILINEIGARHIVTSEHALRFIKD